MTVEQAVYYITMLNMGFSEEFDAWLSLAQEEEDPLSDLVLELSLCGSDVNCTASVLLNHVVAGKEPDYDELEKRIRLFLLDRYRSGAPVKKIVLWMYQVNCILEAHCFEEISTFIRFDLYFDLEESMTNHKDILPQYLDKYLTEGVAPDPMDFKIYPPPSLLQRIRSWWKTRKEGKNHENSR